MSTSEKQVWHLFLILCVVGLFAILSSTMAKNPVLNPFAQFLNAPEAMLGFIAAASTIPGILISLPAGSLSDVFGRRRVLIASGFVFATAPFLYLLVGNWWQLALVRFYHGFATAMFGPVANAFVAELYPQKKGERMSLFSSVTAVGRTAAPLLGGYILSITNYGFHDLYLAVAFAGVTAFIVMFLLREGPSGPRPPDEKPSGQAVGALRGWILVARNPGIVAASVVQASQYYAFGAVEFFLVGYLKEVVQLDPLSIGMVSGLQAAMIPIGGPAMGALSDRIGRKPLIVFGSVVGAAALVLFPLTTHFYLILALSVAYGLGFSMVTSSTPPLVSELTSKELVGTGMGFLSTIMDVGQTLGPIVTGLILGFGFGYVGSFVGIAAILLAACFVFLVIGIWKK